MILPELVEEHACGSRSCLRCYSDLLKHNYHNEQKSKGISIGVDNNDNNHDKNNDNDHDKNNYNDHDKNNDLDIKKENKITINYDDNFPTTYDDKENTYQDRNVLSTPNASSSMMSILKITRNEGCWEYDDDSNATLTPLSAVQVLTPLSEF